MSNVQQFFGSGTGASGLYQFHAQTLSGSFTVRTRGKYSITATGGGGAGGNAFGSGGGAGGLAQSLLQLEVGDVVSYVCGAGATTASAAGGNTTVSINGTGILTSMGGTGGAAGAGGTVGVGGTASGGNQMNITGGNGAVGQMLQPGYGWPYGNGGGGGAVGVYGKVCNAQGNSGWGAGTCGSTNVNYFMNAVEIQINQISSASEFTSAYFGALAVQAGGGLPIHQNRILLPTGYSDNAALGPIPGRGGNPVTIGSVYDNTYTNYGGIFAGGGCKNLGNYYGGVTNYGGHGGLFGGGGAGGGSVAHGQGLSNGGRGGDGGIIIEWMAYTL